MKFSVIFFTRNRRNILKKCIEKFIEQDYPDKEIIVADNGSTDGTSEMISSLFPEIILITLDKNLGCEAFNIALERATGDIIWRTDDDSHPETPYEMTKAAKVFEEHADIHIIAMEDLEYYNDMIPLDYHPYSVNKSDVPSSGYPTYTFIGCGAAIRKPVLDNVGGFWDFGFEELELSTRAIIHGYNISYFPNIRFVHYTNKGGASYERFEIMGSQMARYIWKYFPIEYALGRHALLSCMQFVLALGAGFGIVKAFKVVLLLTKTAAAAIKNERAPVKRSALSKITLGQYQIVNDYRLVMHKIRKRLRLWQKK